ncbi:hypothetical protein HYO99_gp37 [Roseobacter phage RD-1410W1-01]|uniref:Uncharacterized protein n=1 Tax=Roseobacter phage RD-1410W1-01 TaxID=1815984 RepID=A0A191VYI5_9CAUD|nr:hypothetical protein HYO99_gp37 [Roseobacter phage RD-1410W1-01]ANJ20771.1 hypothetical protein RDp01_gp37 [Roseobacter phage RD-1410W1-01]
MSELTLNQIMGPRYEIVIQREEVVVGPALQLNLVKEEPLRINVGDGFNKEVVSTGTLDVTIYAAETLNAYRAVGHDGLFTQPTVESLSNYAGVTRSATVIGDPIDVVRAGMLEEGAWNWPVNVPIFISLQGVLTTTIPTGLGVTGVRRIGWTVSPTKINLDPYPIIGV